MGSTAPVIDFVSTSVSERILDLINLASQLEDNAAIYGVPGVGKTFALKHYFNGSGDDPFRMFTLDRAAGLNSTYVINQLCDSYGISPAHSRATSFDRFRRYAEDYFYGERQIIIFDEAQNLKIETLKDFANLNHDHALNITFVFCGNAELLKTVSSKKADFYSLTRRIKQRTTINTIEDRDADALAAAFGVDDKRILQTLRNVGQQDYVDGIVSLMRAAQQFAAGKPINIQHINDAFDVYPHYRSALK
jgi:DNA transposition AAA+ family ATPase